MKECHPVKLVMLTSKQRWESQDKSTIPTDIFSWLLKAKDETDQSAPPGEGALNEDSRLIIIAGRYAFPTP